MSQVLLQNKLECLMVSTSQGHSIQLMPVQYTYVDVTPTSSGNHGISDEKRKIYGMTSRTIPFLRISTNIAKPAASQDS